MASTTGIELGPDSCVLAAVRPARGGLRVTALHVIEPSQWPPEGVTVAAELGEARRTKRFPRHARVVAWQLPEGSTPHDPAAKALLKPLTTAGFHIDAILSPPEALALIAAGRPRTAGAGAVAWLALNTHGAAIAIVRGTELLFSRTFSWSYDVGVVSSKAHLLQRYSLVSRLAPEVRNGIAMVRTTYGAIVEAAVTCGDLPELRSLTMPLIEELDLEVETLDSTEGLTAAGTARAERFAELAPAIRLACAASSARIKRPREKQTLAAAVAAIVIVGALGWGGYQYWGAGTAPAPRNAAVVKPASTKSTATANAAPGTAPSPPAPSGGKPPAQGPVTSPRVPVSQPSPAPANPSAQQSQRVAADTTAAHPSAKPPAVSGTRASTPAPQVARNDTRPNAPTVTAPPKPQVPVTPAPQRAAPSTSPSRPPVTAPPATPPSSGQRMPSPPSTMPPAALKPAPVPSSSASSAAAAKPVERAPAPIDSSPRRPDDPGLRRTDAPGALPASPPIAGVPERAAPGAPLYAPSRRTPASRQVPLKQPLPHVESILIDQERRLAVVDGEIVKVGDAIGPRVVTLIDLDGVVVREPSGLTIRVPLRGKGTD